MSGKKKEDPFDDILRCSVLAVGLQAMGSSKRLNKRYVYMTHEPLPWSDCNRTTEVHVDALVRHIFSMFRLYACMQSCMSPRLAFVRLMALAR